MESLSYIIPSHYAYLEIPSAALRNWVDGLAPSLAKCPVADIASGRYHRLFGHDLILDVFSTAKSDGLSAALHQAGHIALTDFPTRDGIPIPLLSNSGLGEWLVNSAGISRGWLCVNVCDTGIGVLAIADGSKDLLLALNGELPMSLWTFFDTFVEGTIEVTLAYHWKNPLLLLGGIENILAGGISAIDKVAEIWREYSVPLYVDPIAFLGAGMVSACAGFFIGYALLGESLPDSLLSSFKSGAIGALFTISAGCGFGVILGFAAFSYGKALASGTTTARIHVSQESLEMLLQEIVQADPDIPRIIATAKSSLFTVSASEIFDCPAEMEVFSDRSDILCLTPDTTDHLFSLNPPTASSVVFPSTPIVEDVEYNLFSPDTDRLIF
ncbi:MAG: hypothetical protein LIQ31_11050 [Planctomycetes bacterium]|nr:hypothetical protein [Planctomycetota bacterium]